MPPLKKSFMKQGLFTILVILFLFGCDKTADSFSAAASITTGQGGSLARFTIVGNYLYAVDKENLKVFDITDAAQPVFKRSIAVGFGIETIFPFKDKLFVGSTSAVHIFTLDDPSNPVKLSEAISPTVIRRCDPVVAKDTVAYATLRANGPCGGTGSILAVYNIKNVTLPVEVAQRQLGEPYGLGYSGNTLYVCDKSRGLVIFDITQAYNPVFIRAISGVNFIDVIPYNNVLVCWEAAGMTLYDITNKQNPALITQIH
jgi:hypothetical protein